MPNSTTPYPSQTSRSRLGLHYYPDALHYRACDLSTWLPELKAMGISWLTLVAPLQHAIPEPFLQGLIRSGIEPVLHFRLPLYHHAHDDTLQLLFQVYADWGVRYVTLFDRPNQRSAWPASAWAHSDLVERFLDIFLPVADAALQAGLTPVFPPLEPGGDYWDTAFVRAALESLERRGQTTLLDALHLSAYAWADEERSLDWGAGGPERWPGVHPYNTPADQQDQRGFYIFDWYLAEAEAALGEPRPILLLAAGRRLNSSLETPATEFDELEHANINLNIVRRFMGNGTSEGLGEPISPHVLACNFWLLAADPTDPLSSQAWFQPDGFSLPVVGALSQLAVTPNSPDAPEQTPTPSAHPIAENQPPNADAPDEPLPSTQQPAGDPIPQPATLPPATPKSISHYLLLPMTEWGAAEWHLDAARPYILKYHPTMGYSPSEAALAERVIVVGGEQVFSEDLLNELRQHGCQVTRIAGDGIEIATQLAST